MKGCREIIYGEEYIEYIVEHPGELTLVRSRYEPECIQVINEKYVVIHKKLREISMNDYGYYEVPKVYGLLDTANVVTTKGTYKNLMNNMELPLHGENVIIGFIDTGIDFRHPAFQSGDNQTRIQGIWDQTVEEGQSPPGFFYGVEYTKEQINEAIGEKESENIVPSRDMVGHGTFMAGVAAGRQQQNIDFMGVASEADMVVVKLKEAKPSLKAYYGIQEGIIAYSEVDIMMGIKYLLYMSAKLGKPLVICLGVGTNFGGHTGSSILAKYLSNIGRGNGVIPVVGAGNEGNRGHHIETEVVAPREHSDVQLHVGTGEKGFVIELWSKIPVLFSVGFVSPKGEFIDKIPLRTKKKEKVLFIFERTNIIVEYQIIENGLGDEVVWIRFQDPTPGIWRIQVYNDSDSSGTCDLWLPMEGFLVRDTYFIRADSNLTICEPGNGEIICAATYNHQNGSLYINGSRGYTRKNEIKPDITAPGVNVLGPWPGGRFSLKTGSSIAAAYTAGGVALLLEWGIIKGNMHNLNAKKVQRILISGAHRENIIYPNREWGFGVIDLVSMFEKLLEEEQ